jgi:hypothetical protein
MIPVETDKENVKERQLVLFPFIVFAVLIGVMALASFSDSKEMGITGTLTKDTTGVFLIPMGFYPLTANRTLVKQGELIGTHLTLREREAIASLKRILVINDFKILSDSILEIRSSLGDPEWLAGLVNHEIRPFIRGKQTKSKNEGPTNRSKIISLQLKIDALQVELYDAQQAWRLKTGEVSQNQRLERIHSLEKALNTARKELGRQISRTDNPKQSMPVENKVPFDIEPFLLVIDSILQQTEIKSKASGFIDFPIKNEEGRLDGYEILPQIDLRRWIFEPTSDCSVSLTGSGNVQLRSLATNQLIFGNAMAGSGNNINILVPLSMAIDDKAHWTFWAEDVFASESLLKQIVAWRGEVYIP